MASKTHTSFLNIAITCALFIITNAFTIPMIPIDSPELQMLPQNFTTKQHHELLMDITMSRASFYSTRQILDASHINSIQGTVTALLSSYYVTQIWFGTNAQPLNAYVLLNTVSYLTWVQCQGCTSCFQLHNNINANSSSTYKLISLQDKKCYTKHDFKGSCGYLIKYGDGSITSEGKLGTDTFVFINSTTRQPMSFKNITFGCGYENKNFHFSGNTGPNNIIAGFFGLFPGPISFLNQLDMYNVVKGRFSYCLTSWADRVGSKCTMHFGDAAQIRGEGIQQICMQLYGGFQLFFTGISVEGERLPINISHCQVDTRNPHKGFIIDSGGPFTILHSSIYQPLEAAIITFFRKQKWSRHSHPVYDLCFTEPLLILSKKFPNVTFHFQRAGGGAEVSWKLSKDNMFTEISEIFHGVCMMVKKADTRPCFFGAFQQANFRVLYDYKNKILAFKSERCKENHLV